MSKRQFRIGDLAKELKVKKFVIRFWEKEFDLKSDRSHGGQRFYSNEDLETFLLIKDLLYAQGFTIAGAKKQLAALLRGEVLPAQKVSDETTATNQPQSYAADDSEEEDADHDDSEDDDDEVLSFSVPEATAQILATPVVEQTEAIAITMATAQEETTEPVTYQEPSFIIPATEEHSAASDAILTEKVSLPQETEISQNSANFEQAKEQLENLLAQEREKVHQEMVAQLKPIKEKLLKLKNLMESKA